MWKNANCLGKIIPIDGMTQIVHSEWGGIRCSERLSISCATCGFRYVNPLVLFSKPVEIRDMSLSYMVTSAVKFERARFVRLRIRPFLAAPRNDLERSCIPSGNNNKCFPRYLPSFDFILKDRWKGKERKQCFGVANRKSCIRHPFCQFISQNRLQPFHSIALIHT